MTIIGKRNWNDIIFYERGIARRMDYEYKYSINYNPNTGKMLINDYNGTSEYTSWILRNGENQNISSAISLIACANFISSDFHPMFNIIAQFIFCTSGDMFYSQCWYGPGKSNWDATIVEKPKPLTKGRCLLWKGDSPIKILHGKKKAQEYTYYMLPEWWDDYLHL